MATIVASAAVVAPYGLGRFAPLSVRRKSLVEGRGFAAAAANRSSSPDTQPSAARPLHSLFQDAPKFDVSSNWTGRIVGTDLGKVLTPIAASAGLYLQNFAHPTFTLNPDTAFALEEVVKVEDPPDDLLAVVLTSGFYAFLYFLVIPAIVYNYLRLRWYKRNAAETFFQFMLVFVFFPGMLLLAPFINFRRLPKEGTEPP